MQVTPRDFLANERTFLAYVRTALSFVAFGFVVARFALFAREFAFVEHLPTAQTSTVSTSLGVVMTFTGIVVAVYGALRFAAQDRALRQGNRRRQERAQRGARLARGRRIRDHHRDRLTASSLSARTVQPLG